MLDGIQHINANDIEYPIAFTFNVMENIQETYGSLDKWLVLLEPEQGEPKIKDIKWTIAEFINEGIDIENEKKKQNRPFVTLKQAGRIISNLGLQGITEKITDLTLESFKDDTQTETVKNEITTPNL